MSGDREAVRVDGLVKDFHPGLWSGTKRVLDDVSFGVEAGEIFGFVGPNGAGKTTTLKILMGLIHASAGRASILGHDVGETEFRRHVGFLPEAPYFYDYLTGREFLRFYAKVCGVPKEERPRRIETLLEWVGLSHASGERLRTYSKGMLQRIGIGQALIHDPTVVFLDEPMSGLDPIGRKEIRDLIRQLQLDGKTVFMNTHILSDVEMLCDRVAIIVKGKIRFEGRPDEVVESEEHLVELVFARLAPDFATELEDRYGASLRGRSERVEVALPGKAVDEVLKRALAEGAAVLSVTPQRRSLEEIFLSAVEGGDTQ